MAEKHTLLGGVPWLSWVIKEGFASSVVHKELQKLSIAPELSDVNAHCSFKHIVISWMQEAGTIYCRKGLTVSLKPGWQGQTQECERVAWGEF